MGAGIESAKIANVRAVMEGKINFMVTVLLVGNATILRARNQNG
jgi:hypothetical protein